MVCAALASPSEPTLAAERTQASDARGLVQLCTHLMLLLWTGYLVLCAQGRAWWMLVSTLHGIVLTHLYAPLHEATHYTAFRSRLLCDIVAWCCGILTTFNSHFFRFFHKEHHRRTQQRDQDPELPGANGSLQNYLAKLFGAEFFVALRGLFMTAWHGKAAVQNIPWVPKCEVKVIVQSVRVQLIVYAFVAYWAYMRTGACELVVYLWLLPLLLGQPFLWGMFILQHTNTEYNTADARRNSRVVLAVPKIYNLIAWNMPYHAVHHMFPQVPFHQLPRVFDDLHSQDEFRYVSKGLLRSHAALLLQIFRPSAKVSKLK